MEVGFCCLLVCCSIFVVKLVTPSMEGGSSRASNTVNTTNNTSASVATVRVNGGDPAWEWGYIQVPAEKGITWCKLCDKRMSGGVTRLKHHLCANNLL